MSIIKDIKTILQQQGFSETIYLSYLPDEDNAVALYQSGGKGTGKADGVEEPTFQVRLRNEDYETGISILENIKDILNGLNDVVVSNNRYLSFYITSDIIELGRDEQGRFNFSLNFRTYVERNFDKTAYATQAVENAESLKTQDSVNHARECINLLPDDNPEKAILISRLDAVQDYIDKLKQAIHDVEKAESTKTQADLDVAIQSVSLLTTQPEKDNLKNRLILIQSYIQNENGGIGKILIDVGTIEFASSGNINNLTGFQVGSPGSKIENLIDVKGIPTGISLEVYRSFDLADVNGMDEDGIYYATTIKDYFGSYAYAGTLVFKGLDPNKLYRVTCFGSRALSGRSSKYIIQTTADVYINQALYLNVSYNTSNAVSKTLKPSQNGEIFVITTNDYGNWAYLNALELEEIRTVI